MKLFIALIILGIAEVVAIGKLHQALGTIGLVTLYVVTTAVAGLFALAFYGNYKQNKKKAKPARKFRKRAFVGRANDNDIASLKASILCMAYLIGCISIFIPGIITDILGLLLIFPSNGTYLAEKLWSPVLKGFQVRGAQL